MSGKEKDERHFEIGQLVRLRKLGLMQMSHEGCLAAVRDQVRGKGSWKVVLSSGENLDVASGKLKPVDDEGMFRERELVRLTHVAHALRAHEGEVVAVQKYLPQKDAWLVCLRNGERAEVYSENLKKVDPDTLLPASSVMRITQGAGKGEIVTVQCYDHMSDAWSCVNQAGESRQCYSEHLVYVDPEAFTEGQLVVFDPAAAGTPSSIPLLSSSPVPTSRQLVAVQQYTEEIDSWKLVTSSGVHFEAFKESLRPYDPNAEEEGDQHHQHQQHQHQNQHRHQAKPLEKIKGTFKSFFSSSSTSTTTTSSSSSSGPGHEPPEADRGGFLPGQQAHLKGVFLKEDGTIVLLKEFHPRAGKQGKWRVLLQSGDAVDVPSSSLRHPIADPAAYPEGALVTILKDRNIAAIQTVAVERGMVCLRLNTGKPLWVFPDAFEKFPEEEEEDDGGGGGAVPPVPAAAAAHEKPVAGPLMQELLGLLDRAGTTLEETAQYSDADLDELLRDELKVPVIKRNKMKQLLRGGPEQQQQQQQQEQEQQQQQQQEQEGQQRPTDNSDPFAFL